jgi:Tol biopolymer transport system component/DNA-binding winged helix-turn-helix (wHTH) protein
MSKEVNNLYEFGSFRFDGATHQLRQNNELFLLSPKASELLKLLLERGGEFVSKEEIFETVWAGTFVEDGVLTQNIYTLRKVLGKDENGQPLIENRTRLGYRVTVPVKVSVKETNGIHKPATNGNQDSIEEIIFEGGSKKLSTGSNRNWKNLGAILVFGAILLTTTGFFGYRIFRPRIAAFFRAPIESVRFQSLTNTGNIYNSAISPDGNFAAFIKKDAIYLEDIASNKEIKLEIPNVASFSVLQFSPDGNFIYLRASQTLRNDANVLQVSRFGGETRLVAEKTWGSFGVSGDGKQIAFVRNQAEQTKQFLIIKNLETGIERELASVDFPELYLYNCSFAWSPDDRKIAFVVENFTARRTSLFVIDAASGKKEEVKAAPLRKFEQVAWLPDGETLIASANEGGKFFHLWKIFYNSGDVQRITNGLNTYGRISVSADGKKILALQTVENSNIFVADAGNLTDQKQITFGNTNNIGQTALKWAGEDKLIYASYTEENPMSNLGVVNLTDNTRQTLTANTDFNSEAPTVSDDGKFIYFTTTQGAFVNVWRMDASGGNLTQITDGKDGWRMIPQLSPDGKYLYYIFRDRDGGAIKRSNLAEKTEETIIEKGAANPVAALSIAPDGSRLTFMNWSNKVADDNDKTNFQFGVASLQNPAEIKLFDVKMINQIIQMTADGKAFDYVSWGEGKMMILRQSIEGGAPQEIFTLPQTRIFNFAWSKSGKQLAVSQGHQNKDVVLLTNFDK